VNVTTIIVNGIAAAAVIAAIALFLRRGRWKRREKLIGYGISLIAFGIFFGPEPSPMHPVKDFVFRLGAMGKPVVLFAGFFAVLLLVSIVLNRSICAWGCQFGVLQDLIHRDINNWVDLYVQALLLFFSVLSV
jgi:polyferredoxin